MIYRTTYCRYSIWQQASKCSFIHAYSTGYSTPPGLSRADYYRIIVIGEEVKIKLVHAALGGAVFRLCSRGAKDEAISTPSLRFASTRPTVA